MSRSFSALVIVFLLIPFLPIVTSSASMTEGPSGPTAEDHLAEKFAYMSRGWENDIEFDDIIIPMASGRAATPPPSAVQREIARMVDNVSAEYLQWYLTTFVGFGSRLYRAPGMLNASIWMYEVLQGNGDIQAEYHNFTYTRPSTGVTYDLSNVILTIPGVNESSDQIYYMYAHSDAVQMDDPPNWLTNTPGADDDGSGCVSMIEAARILSRYKFHDTIKFGFFQAEELGLLGSGYYAQNMSAWGENVQGGIDYDMIGHSAGTMQDDLELMWNPASRWQGLYMVDVNDRYDIGLSIHQTETSSSIPSDVTRFYQRGFPSVFAIEEDFSPVYHTTADTLEYINFTLIEKATKLAVATLAELSRLLYVDVSVGDDNITVSNDKPSSGEKVEVTVEVGNTGNLNATDMEVEFLADGFPFASRRIWVPANGTNVTSENWTAVDGNHILTVDLDPKNEIPETDETNNTASVHVYVNDRPRAILTANPMTAYTNETIMFNGTLSSDPTGGITGFNFTFGDGNGTGWVTSPVAEHMYPLTGFYEASLLVKDPDGAISYPSNVTVQVVNRVPVAHPTADPTRTLTFNDILFKANASDAEGSVTTHWDFGDGTTSDEADPAHNYSKSGTYDIMLNVEDLAGAKVSYPLRVIIDDRLPECSIQVNYEVGNVTTGFIFTANATDMDGVIVTYDWELDDGASASTKVIEHSYARPGDYVIRLTVRDDANGEARAQVNITVLDLPPKAIADVPPEETYTYKPIYFNGEDSYDFEGPITFAWDFGDGNTSTEAKLIHAYGRPGLYIPSLTVRDTAGQTDTFVLPSVKVSNRPPLAAFRSFGNFTENGTVYFDGTGSSDPESDITYSWDFGDNKTGTGAVVDHVFPKAGDYTVALTVTDTEGDKATVTHVVTVGPPPPPPPPPKKEQPVEQGTGLETLLMLLVIVLVVALIVAIAWGARRGPKGDGTPPENVPDRYPEGPSESTTEPSRGPGSPPEEDVGPTGPPPVEESPPQEGFEGDIQAPLPDEQQPPGPPI